MAFIIYTKELPQGQRKKKKTAAGPSDAPRWAERIPTVSLYLALAGFWQRAAQQSLQQPSRYTSQSRSANRHQRLRRSMDETGQKGRKFCVKKSLFDQKKVPCYCEEVFFFSFSLFSLPPRPQQDHLSEISEIHTESKWTSVEWRKK